VSTAIEIANLFSTLGLRIDKQAWGEADSKLEGMRSSLSGLAKLAVGALAGFGFGAAIKSGVAFNSTMEDTRNQIALMLALSKKTDLADELGVAGELMNDLQERAKKLPGSLSDYTGVLATIAKPLSDAGVSMKDLEDITVGAAVAAKSMGVGLDAGARDVKQALMGQYHQLDQLTSGILGNFGFGGEEGTRKFNALSAERRAAIIKEAFTQKQLSEAAEAQANSASGRWDTFKATVQETLGRVAAPLFAKLSTLLAGVNDWLDKNGEAIERVANVIGGALATALDLVVSTITFLTGGSDEAIAALIGIGVAIATVVVPALAAMAAGWIAAAAPILAVVAAVGFLALGVIKLVKHWDEVKAAGGRAWDWIKERARSLVDSLESLGETIAAPFIAAFKVVKAIASAVINFFVDRINDVIDSMNWVIRKADKLPGVNMDEFGHLDHVGSEDKSRGLSGPRGPVYTPTTTSITNGGMSSVKNVTVGPTTIKIDATNMTPEQLRPHLEGVVDDRLGDHLRAED
jgi:hypothetical protein